MANRLYEEAVVQEIANYIKEITGITNPIKLSEIKQRLQDNIDLEGVADLISTNVPGSTTAIKEKLQEIIDLINEKINGSGSTLMTGLPTLIDWYKQGVYQEKTVTENGEVIADEGYNALSKVIVNIDKNVKLQEKTVTMNGVIMPDKGYDALSKVTVKVAGGSGGGEPVPILGLSNNVEFTPKNWYTTFTLSGEVGMLGIDTDNIIIGITNYEEVSA